MPIARRQDELMAIFACGSFSSNSFELSGTDSSFVLDRLYEDFNAIVFHATRDRAVVGDRTRASESLRANAIGGHAARDEKFSDRVGAPLREFLARSGVALRIGEALDDDLVPVGTFQRV